MNTPEHPDRTKRPWDGLLPERNLRRLGPTARGHGTVTRHRIDFDSADGRHIEHQKKARHSNGEHHATEEWIDCALGRQVVRPHDLPVHVEVVPRDGRHGGLPEHAADAAPPEHHSQQTTCTGRAPGRRPARDTARIEDPHGQSQQARGPPESPLGGYLARPRNEEAPAEILHNQEGGR